MMTVTSYLLGDEVRTAKFLGTWDAYGEAFGILGLHSECVIIMHIIYEILRLSIIMSAKR